MNRKTAKVSPNDTYVLNQEDVEELDELSLTMILEDAEDSAEQPRAAEHESSSVGERPAPHVQHDPEINDLIDSISGEASDDLSGTMPRADLVEIESDEPSQDLLPPESLFPDKDSDNDDS